MSSKPLQSPPAFRSIGRQRARPVRRRPLRDRLFQVRLAPPRIRPPGRKAIGITGAVLAFVALLIAIVVAVWDWNWFRGPLERAASVRLNRQVEIAGDLSVSPWSWQPRATAEGIRIGNPAWAGPGDLGSIDRLTVQVRLIPLLWGDVDLRLLRIDRPDFRLLADSDGRKSWDVSDGRTRAPTRLPPIHSFVIRDGRLSYLDKSRDVRFEGVINARESLGGEGPGFALVGQGTINGSPFRADVSGGPLLNVERDQPYPFDAQIRAGRTFITARGVVPRPFDLGRFQLVTTARGPDLADLFPLTGVALPNTAPYNLRGRLVRDGLIWRIDNFSGWVGDSDLAGESRWIPDANVRF